MTHALIIVAGVSGPVRKLGYAVGTSSFRDGSGKRWGTRRFASTTSR
ncbi:hypothetical protein [Nocardia sp. NPDC051832]